MNQPTSPSITPIERVKSHEVLNSQNPVVIRNHADLDNLAEPAIPDLIPPPLVNELRSDQGSDESEQQSLGSPSYISTTDEPTPQPFEKHSDSLDHHGEPDHHYVGSGEVRNMHKFTLYETSTRFYLVGQDIMEEQFRVLKIDRTSPPENLNIFEDDIVYTKSEMKQLLNTIDDGNKGTGGMKVKSGAWGLLGFIRFTEAYYMLLITKRAQVAMIGGHYVYQVEDTEMVPLTTGSTSRFQRDRNPVEARFLSILNNVDLNRSFYFSYSYNITRTLQHNIIREREALAQGVRASRHDWNDMFVWNQHLLEPAKDALKNTWDWCLPIVHGFIDQYSLNVFGRRVYITIIARRSRFFAGARFLKRGANDEGYVANDVETEQIVSSLITTSFHAPGPKLYANPCYTSYVQHRGSIPLYWTQDNTGVTPKPDIDLNLIDPFYSAGALHFNNLFERYGSPVYALNLIKSRERTPRESKLLHEYQNALNYLNQSLPEDKKILYKPFDMSRISKTRGQDVIGSLEVIAEDIIQKTGFFHNGEVDDGISRVQNGVARTNCIDCLDRTNAAQFVIGKRALGRQLQALGVISGHTVDYDTDAVNTFTHMFHDHGDTIAIQYGGSHLVNTMATYRKINQWLSQSRDMVESFKRYYHNSFLDSQRQEAYNLFLGNYIWSQGQPMLWDLPSDYHLHHADPRLWLDKSRKHYYNWYNPEFLEQRKLPYDTQTHPPSTELVSYRSPEEFDNFWLEYYRPLALSSFEKVFSYKMYAQPKYVHERPPQGGFSDPSPFVPRRPPPEPESPGKKTRKGVTILDPISNSKESDPWHNQLDSTRLHVRGDQSPIKHSILRESSHSSSLAVGQSLSSSSTAFVPADKNLMHQWTLNEFHTNSLNPSVAPSEADEYARYISHPQNLPLVVSSDIPDDPVYDDLFRYAHSLKDGVSETAEINEEDFAEYADHLVVPENPLDVMEEDGGRKRYKAYKQWLRGKSLFKQSKVDREYRAGA